MPVWLLLLILAVAAMQDANGSDLQVLFTFDAAESNAWAAVNDNVMGGLSEGGLDIRDGVLRFSGNLSLENNGGFASVRSQPADPGLGEHHGILLKVRGDGRTYGFRLRTSAAFDGVSYQTPLETERDRWIEIRLPFAAFEPVFRGRRVPGHPALDPAEIKTFGVIIADKNPGPFRLEIDWIKAYRDLG